MEKRMCAHYLFNLWLAFDRTSSDTLLGWGKEVIRFWLPWPNFQGHSSTLKLKFDRKKNLCAHYPYNLWLEFDQTSTDALLGWRKEVIRFWRLSLIFKVTLALSNWNFDRKCLSAHYVLKQQLESDCEAESIRSSLSHFRLTEMVTIFMPCFNTSIHALYVGTKLHAYRVIL